MSLVVNTNVASMNAQRALMHSSRELHTAMERLSTGKKINSAADDAAGFAIAESMTAQIRGLSMAAKNASDGLSLLKVVENATNDVTDMMQRIRELAVQAKSGTNSTGDVANLQLEADALIEEIGRVSKSTTYNGVAYIGSQADDIFIQVGYNDNDNIKLTTKSVHSDNLGTAGGQKLSTSTQAAVTGQYHVATGASAVLDTQNYSFAYGGATLTYDAASGAPANVAALVSELTTGANQASYEALDITLAASGDDVTVTWDAYGALQGNLGDHITASWATWSSTTTGSVATAATDATAESFLDIKSTDALKVISDAIDQVATYKADWGASQNRLGYTVSNLMNIVEFTSAARSRIQDADFAVEAANLAKAQVLQQTGTAMLAQANAAPQLALQLLK